MNPKMSRRSALSKMAAGAAAVSAVSGLAERLEAADSAAGAALKGRINHSVCKWCYPNVELEDLCVAGKAMGLRSIELLEPKDWPKLLEHGLTCAMASGVDGISYGFNRMDHHDELIKKFEVNLPKAVDAGLKNYICFSGNRGGMSDEQGLQNCAVGLKRLMPLAEKHKITICMELLNSKVDHKDYMCDHTKWGVELAKRVGSEYFKLLYDIYHMQIMEGDVIRTIRESHPYIAHYHTGGVPGRHEIDDTQELYYPAVMKAIVETGFKGHVAQEFRPARPDVLASLKQGVQICDV
jgi:hydroxypyruvate isomerase